jgi:hypothetical protein
MNYWFKPYTCFSVDHDPVCGCWNCKRVRSGMLPLCSFPPWGFLSNVDSTDHIHTVSTFKVSTHKIHFFILLPFTATRTGPLLHQPGPQTERIIFSVSSSFTSMHRSSKIQRTSLKSWIFIIFKSVLRYISLLLKFRTVSVSPNTQNWKFTSCFYGRETCSLSLRDKCMTVGGRGDIWT